MKKNYQKGDSINIIKPGIFHGLSGEIMSNNPDTGFKPLSINFGLFGIWQFNYDDVESVVKEKIKPETVMPWEESNPKKEAKKKPETDRVKRKYTRRAK